MAELSSRSESPRKNLLWLSAYPWDDPYKQRLHHMLPYFIERYRVVWIDSLMPAKEKIRTLFKNPLKFFSDHQFKTTEGLEVIRIYATFPCTLANRWPFLYRINGLILLAKIKKHAGRLGIRQFIAGTPHPYMYNHAISRLGAQVTFYDCADDYGAFPWSQPSSNALETHLLKTVDIRFASSLMLQKNRSAMSGKSVHYVPNGVDFNYFKSYDYSAHPMEWPTRPVVGYVGALAEWFDFELLEYVVKNLPSFHFVLVGSTVSATNPILQGLLQTYPNLQWMGQQPYVKIPAFIRSFDIGMIPFRRSPLIEGVSPIKLFEYSACGLPVVSIRWAELESYQHEVHLADTPADFVLGLTKATQNHNPENQKDFAARNSWKERVARIATTLDG
jgi:glycosyltransferase involved in cell wall biosynthesis